MAACEPYTKYPHQIFRSIQLSVAIFVFSLSSVSPIADDIFVRADKTDDKRTRMARICVAFGVRLSRGDSIPSGNQHVSVVQTLSAQYLGVSLGELCFCDAEYPTVTEFTRWVHSELHVIEFGKDIIEKATRELQIIFPSKTPYVFVYVTTPDASADPVDAQNRTWTT